MGATLVKRLTSTERPGALHACKGRDKVIADNGTAALIDAGATLLLLQGSRWPPNCCLLPPSRTSLPRGTQISARLRAFEPALMSPLSSPASM